MSFSKSWNCTCWLEVARAISVFWKSHLCNLIPNWAKNCMITFINISELLFSCHLLGLCKSDDIDLVQVNFKGVNLYLEYNTQVNSAFCAHWLASSEVISQVLFTSEQPKKNKMAFVGILSQTKLLFGLLVIQLVWYILKTIIHLSGGESSGYSVPPLWWIIVTYYKKLS